jgi:hypothetical protein
MTKRKPNKVRARLLKSNKKNKVHRAPIMPIIYDNLIKKLAFKYGLSETYITNICASQFLLVSRLFRGCNLADPDTLLSIRLHVLGKWEPSKMKTITNTAIYKNYISRIKNSLTDMGEEIPEGITTRELESYYFKVCRERKYKNKECLQ